MPVEAGGGVEPDGLDFDASGSISIAAPIAAVWELASDITRRGEFSPENLGGRWRGAVGGVGSQFVGRNRRDGRDWTTLCTVTVWEPPRAFAYEVFGGARAGSIWTFELTEGAWQETVLLCRFELGPSTEAGWRANMLRLDREAALRWTAHRRSEIEARIATTLARMKMALEGPVQTQP